MDFTCWTMMNPRYLSFISKLISKSLEDGPKKQAGTTRRAKQSYKYESILRIITAQQEIWQISQKTLSIILLGEQKLSRDENTVALVCFLNNGIY